MRTIAHIINPFDSNPDSDLFIAQPITFKSMTYAREKAKAIVSVELFAVKFENDAIAIPDEFNQTENLKRSVLDLQHFSKPVKLPLISDILERLYHSNNAEYLIYTNVDIGLYPEFYLKVNEFIDEGHDAFIINRRRISSEFKSVDELPLIYKEKGKRHPGFDCFVFKRELFPRFKLEGICIGVPFFEITFSQNLFCLAENFKLFDQEILTFHIGMEIFKKRAPMEYFDYNKKRFWLLIKEMKPDLKKFPYQHKLWPWKIMRWALNPCIPIKLVVQLELKRFSSLNKTR